MIIKCFSDNQVFYGKLNVSVIIKSSIDDHRFQLYLYILMIIKCFINNRLFHGQQDVSVNEQFQ